MEKGKHAPQPFCLWDCHRLKEVQSALQAGFSAHSHEAKCEVVSVFCIHFNVLNDHY